MSFGDVEVVARAAKPAKRELKTDHDDCVELPQTKRVKPTSASVDTSTRHDSDDREDGCSRTPSSTYIKSERQRYGDGPLVTPDHGSGDQHELCTMPSPNCKGRSNKHTSGSADISAGKDDDNDSTKPKEPKKKGGKAPDQEKRLKRFRAAAPGAYWKLHNRVMTQRMVVITRARSGSEQFPKETVELAGTTGNVYTVQIKQVPSCNCPHALKGNQCKHVVYVMAKVLRAPENLQYQLALLSSEVREILANAPPILTEENTARDGIRKPIEGDCPICCSKFEADEDIAWCKAACGNNVHQSCFGQWAATRKGQSGGITCPFCRTLWIGDEDMLKRIAKSGKRNAEGYVNLAPELGISGQRDYSTYHRHWVRRQQRDGVDVGDWIDPGW